jgi:hypothetical protein
MVKWTVYASATRPWLKTMARSGWRSSVAGEGTSLVSVQRCVAGDTKLASSLSQQGLLWRGSVVAGTATGSVLALHFLCI